MLPMTWSVDSWILGERKGQDTSAQALGGAFLRNQAAHVSNPYWHRKIWHSQKKKMIKIQARKWSARKCEEGDRALRGLCGHTQEIMQAGGQ